MSRSAINARIEIAQIIRSRRKTVALIVERDGSLVVRAPLRFSERQIAELVRAKEKWIRSKQEQARLALIPPQEYADGAKFLYLGHSYPLEIVEKQRPALRLGEHFTLAQAALPRAEATFKAWHANQARQVIPARVETYAARFGFAYQRVRISAARTRWGSCGKNGSLNFSWRLVMAPLAVIDYVVVHELVHLRVRNHSATYWSQVAQIIPDYRQYRNWLKQNGARLRI